MKLKITLDNKRSFEVEVEVAETDHAALPPAYPVGSAVLSGSLVNSPGAATGTAAGGAVDEDPVFEKHHRI